jgi:uncharacterized membrane protein YedE/YeeE
MTLTAARQFGIGPKAAVRTARPYLHPYMGGIVLGIVLFLAFLLTGNGLGASGGMNRIVVFAQDLVMPQHIDRVPYLLEMAGGDKNPLENWVVFVVVGAVIGGFASGWLNGRFKIETKHGPRITPRTRWIMAFLGGAIMGYGARLARGCTSGQALSGGATLSLGSWVLMMCVFAGGYALAYFVRRLWT